MKKKIIYYSVIVFALLFIVGLYYYYQNRSSQKSEGTKIESVRIGSFSTAVDYAPYLIAKNKGWFEEAFKDKGIKVEYITFQSLPPLNEALATNKVDVLFQAEPPAIVGRAAGIDVKIVDISCSITLGILVNSNSNIETVVDLKKKKIALLAGTGAHYGVLKILERNGISKKDVEIIDMMPPDAKNAFETGKVDAWAVWSPFIDQVELSKKGRVLPNSNFEIQSIMAARGKFISDNKEEFAIIQKVFRKSKEWMLQNPQEAQSIVAKELGLDLEVVQKAWGRHNWSVELSPEIIRDIQNKADFLFNEGFVEKQINVERDLINASVAEQ